jgi:hypothetical protein
MMRSNRVVKEWTGWQLICVEEEEYLLARHDGLDIDFDAPNDEEAIKEAIRLMGEIE